MFLNTRSFLAQSHMVSPYFRNQHKMHYYIQDALVTVMFPLGIINMYLKTLSLIFMNDLISLWQAIPPTNLKSFERLFYYRYSIRPLNDLG